MDATLTFSVTSATSLCVSRLHYELFLFNKNMSYNKIKAEISDI